MSQATHELFERRGVHVVKRILIRFIEVAIDAQHSDPHVGVVLVILVKLRQGLVEETEVVGNACLHVVRLKVGLDRRELNGEELSRGCITFDEAEDVEEVHRPLVLSEDVEHSARVNGSPAAPNTELDEVALHARGERVLNAVANVPQPCVSHHRHSVRRPVAPDEPAVRVEAAGIDSIASTGVLISDLSAVGQLDGSVRMALAARVGGKQRSSQRQLDELEVLGCISCKCVALELQDDCSS